MSTATPIPHPLANVDAQQARDIANYSQLPATRQAYLRGIIAGMTRASFRIGPYQYIGHSGKLLSDAIAEVEKEFGL